MITIVETFYKETSCSEFKHITKAGLDRWATEVGHGPPNILEALRTKLTVEMLAIGQVVMTTKT